MRHLPTLVRSVLDSIPCRRDLFRWTAIAFFGCFIPIGRADATSVPDEAVRRTRRKGKSKRDSTKDHVNCSFCRQSYRKVAPLVEGPGHVYICGDCIDLCQSILRQEQERRASKSR